MNASDRHADLRAVEFLAPLNITLDHAAREYAEIRIMLAGKATPAEACRDWLKRNAVPLPRVTVAAAVEQMKKQAETDGKSDLRLKHWQMCWIALRKISIRKSTSSRRN